MQIDHRLNGRENISEECPELGLSAGEAAYLFDLSEKFLGREHSEFIAGQQGGMIGKKLRGIGRRRAERDNAAGGDGIIKVHQDFAEIENENREFHRIIYEFISRRPSRARLRVSSSANSNPVPAGNPCAMRVIFRPGRASRLPK